MRALALEMVEIALRGAVGFAERAIVVLVKKRKELEDARFAGDLAAAIRRAGDDLKKRAAGEKLEESRGPSYIPVQTIEDARRDMGVDDIPTIQRNPHTVGTRVNLEILTPLDGDALAAAVTKHLERERTATRAAE